MYHKETRYNLLLQYQTECSYCRFLNFSTPLDYVLLLRGRHRFEGLWQNERPLTKQKLTKKKNLPWFESKKGVALLLQIVVFLLWKRAFKSIYIARMRDSKRRVWIGALTRRSDPALLRHWGDNIHPFYKKEFKLFVYSFFITIHFLWLFLLSKPKFQRCLSCGEQSCVTHHKHTH